MILTIELQEFFLLMFKKSTIILAALCAVTLAIFNKSCMELLWENVYNGGMMINSRVFNVILLVTIIGEFLVPFILKHFYPGYDSKMMVMSALGSPESPVRLFYNIWLVWLGCFLGFTAFVYFSAFKGKFPVLSVLLLLSVLLFAVGAGVLSGIFSVNESKDTVTVASKIHGAGAAIGFMALLFFPLLSALIAFRQNDAVFGAVCIVSFILSLVCFAFFIMGDKEEFSRTFFRYEGLWERLNLLFMYVPFVYKAVQRIFQAGNCLG